MSDASKWAKAQGARLRAGEEPSGAFKVWVIADGSGKWVTAGIEFDSATDAGGYASSLATRWTLVRHWLVLPIGDDPNQLDMSPDDYGVKVR